MSWVCWGGGGEEEEEEEEEGEGEGEEEEEEEGGGGGGGGEKQLAYYNPTHHALVDIQFAFSTIHRSGRAAKNGEDLEH